MTLFHFVFDKLYPLIRFYYERLRQHRWYDPIIDNIWLGGAPSYRRDYDFLLSIPVKAVVDIRQEREDDLALYGRHGIAHIKLRVPDVYPPPPEIIEAGVTFIHQHVTAGDPVYVHCAKGRARSATLVAGYLMKYHEMGFQEARTLLQTKRPLVLLEKRHARVLEQWRSDYA